MTTLPYDEAASQIFLSYSHHDEETALAIDQWLRDHHLRVLIDRRNFTIGADIRDEIVRWIGRAGKVVAIYSRSSADRPYPKLERRLAEEREHHLHEAGATSPVLILFAIDDAELPPESRHRLAILAAGMSFQEACRLLLAAILEEERSPKRVDLTKYDAQPPWQRSFASGPNVCPKCGAAVAVIQ